MCPLQWRQFSHPSCVECDKWSGPHLLECLTSVHKQLLVYMYIAHVFKFNPLLYSYDYTIRKRYKLILDNDDHSCALQCVLFRYSVIPCFAACSFQAFGYFNTIACTPTSKSSCTWLLRVKGRSKEETGILRQVLTRTRLPIMNFLSLCVHCRDGSSAIPTVLSATSDLVLKLNIVVFTKTVIYYVAHSNI